MKKFYPLYLLFLLMSACGWSDKKVPDGKALLKEELEKIDWTQVDAYPSVELCDSLLNESQRKQCFFDYMTIHLQEKLMLDSLTSKHPKIDTIEIRITVFPDAHVIFEPVYVSDSLKFRSREIDSLLQVRLVDFPEISPAIKRGIPVKTQFVLPLIIKEE
ncbi:hypothetical protein [Flavobacterium sp. HSC-61S13]|uniref:hypothetical protein n=1 Tax=Flavobacterium sp. HSC-61S13 TaxID=2910963 RepID=UPI0020A0CA21|nr:hypothetical protein [Flavobacterium sp. HSC-61S13]MCP1995367.1 hypothetical protein [Flavobacterium sp. HSC-61S13]